mmetsp:Transcript_119070/g.333593  ORF Transcript_119070/g.333593 Transcript_119070/m.333593 type:complete len:226 (-) Transcript_119070:145-822(-)
MLIFEHVVILHSLSPDDLAPTRLNLVGLRSNLVDLGRHHRFSCLICFPLLHRAHRLSVQFIHSRRLLLYMRHDRDVSNGTFHQSLSQHPMRTVWVRLVRGLTRNPASRLLDFLFDCIILLNFSGEFQVKLFSVQIREEIVALVSRSTIVNEQEETENSCHNQQIEHRIRLCFCRCFLERSLSPSILGGRHCRLFASITFKGRASIRVHVHSLFCHFCFTCALLIF